jgi:hypothetical protein
MGIQPCYSGLQVKGTAAPPPSTHFRYQPKIQVPISRWHVSQAEREGFEPSRQTLWSAYTISSRALSTNSAISPYKFLTMIHGNPPKVKTADFSSGRNKKANFEIRLYRHLCKRRERDSNPRRELFIPLLDFESSAFNQAQPSLHYISAARAPLFCLKNFFSILAHSSSRMPRVISVLLPSPG